MAPEGLLLLKPDGAASPAVRAALDEALARHGLTVLARRSLRLAPAEVEAIWPMFTGGAHPMMAALYRHYMSSGPSEAMLLGGRDAPAGCAAVKADIRRAFEVCAIENAIHAPADAQELAANRACLFERAPRPPDRNWPDWIKRGRSGAALAVPDAEIDRIAAAIWADRLAGGWAQVFHAIPHDTSAPYRAALRPGDPNSIDHGLSVLFEALPAIGYEACVRLYLAAEVTGRAVLAAGSRVAMEAIRDDLARHSMVVEIDAR